LFIVGVALLWLLLFKSRFLHLRMVRTGMVLLSRNTNHNLPNSGLRLQRLERGDHVLEVEFLRNDGLDRVRAGKGGEFGYGVA
jgi:hypothetical protein